MVPVASFHTHRTTRCNPLYNAGHRRRAATPSGPTSTPPTCCARWATWTWRASCRRRRRRWVVRWRVAAAWCAVLLLTYTTLSPSDTLQCSARSRVPSVQQNGRALTVVAAVVAVAVAAQMTRRRRLPPTVPLPRAHAYLQALPRRPVMTATTTSWMTLASAARKRWTTRALTLILMTAMQTQMHPRLRRTSAVAAVATTAVSMRTRHCRRPAGWIRSLRSVLTSYSILPVQAHGRYRSRHKSRHTGHYSQAHTNTNAVTHPW